MERLFFLSGSAMAAFMDFCVGTAIVTLVGTLLYIEVPLWFLPIAGVLAFLPDFDVIIPILRQAAGGREVEGDHHQTVMHRPLLLLTTVALVSFLLGGTFWLVVALACVTWHYIHDTNFFGMGGIAWFWPLSKYYWSPTRGFESFEGRRDEKTHTDWLWENWLHPSPLSIIEIILGLVALSYSLSHFFSLYDVAALWVVIWGGAFVVWGLYIKFIASHS